MRFKSSKPSQVPGELLAVYAKTRRTIIKASVSDGGAWRLTSDSGRTVVWTRKSGVISWRAKLEVRHAK